MVKQLLTTDGTAMMTPGMVATTSIMLTEALGTVQQVLSTQLAAMTAEHLLKVIAADATELLTCKHASPVDPTDS